MTWIVAGIAVAGGIYKGVRAANTNLAPARSAALGVKQEQMELVGDVKTQAYEQAGSQFAGAQRDVSMGTGIGIRDIGASADIARSQSNLATSGTIEQKVVTQTGDLMAKYKSDMTKLFETRDLSMAEADLSYRSGALSAEEAYEKEKTDISSQKVGWKLW